MRLLNEKIQNIVSTNLLCEHKKLIYSIFISIFKRGRIPTLLLARENLFQAVKENPKKKISIFQIQIIHINRFRFLNMSL